LSSNLPPFPRIEGDWYFETERSGFAQGVRVRQRILKLTTPFQRLEILESDPYGRVLVLDDAFQTSEGDEFMYHEMLVHVPLITHPNPVQVLVIGGGDGGTLRRVLEHPTTRPTQVEIDRAVIESCTEHIPSIAAGAFASPRAQVVIGDGVEFMRNNPGQFDVVVVDSTDPIGPAVQLFEAPFYRDVARSLADDGLMVAQSSSPLFMADELRSQVANLRAVFPLVRTYLGIVPGYPGSLWSYSIGSKRYDPLAVQPDVIAERLRGLEGACRYYSPDVHHAAFVLPPFVADIVA
jgi:spermidine synthase